MRIFIFTSLLFLSACGNPFGGAGSNVESGHDPGVPQDIVGDGNVKSGDFVSSSAQLVQTPTRHYIVSQSLGELTQDSRTKTSRGYTVFSNIQGTLISESQ
jgi:hypothetical protein